ncbi:hypothetical protein DSAG12_00077 [Promethearchaeum syntrophicum]|uniref:Uncharacterized protein n=1 Tax=Promethearchaeum syntrophicum TaxID=2594042 RepID=A0A5B9D5J9_9ARCH|nr:hypothetical protein [Candidatus Prometheoarchaeum syntrophicum]QEE14266.1 hypothetical protein DSAG12_00077 [Candidatus Prometheoarchaeum syntrophicum]
MIKPFLEISIERTLEEELSKLEMLKKIGKAFKLLYKKDPEIVDLGDKSFIRINFESKNDFEKIYEKSFSFYVFIFENFIDNNLEFQSIFHEKGGNLDNSIENYLVLRYKTNTINPIKHYFGFTTKVNKIFGAEVINEELHDGYLRFLQTKEDFETLLTPGDIREGWEEFFKIKKIDLDHPQIKEFFKVIEKWEELF